MDKPKSTDEAVDLIDLPALRLDKGKYKLPETIPLYQKFTQYSIDDPSDICIISPTLRSEYLDYHEVAALFQDMSTLTPVFHYFTEYLHSGEV